MAPQGAGRGRRLRYVYRPGVGCVLICAPCAICSYVGWMECEGLLGLIQHNAVCVVLDGFVLCLVVSNLLFEPTSVRGVGWILAAYISCFRLSLRSDPTSVACIVLDGRMH